MSPLNGYATGPERPSSENPGLSRPPASEWTPEKTREVLAALEVPFEPSVVEWRVTHINQPGHRGRVIPYANPRAYTDRLNQLLTPAGWTRRYVVHTSPNFQRSTDQRTVAKVFVTCEVTILGLGSHSGTGEEWTDRKHAGTSAEAQAFKRACCCFGLGRYLYSFTGVWVDLDERQGPRRVPSLPMWATPSGWLQGLRPGAEVDRHPAGAAYGGNLAQPCCSETAAAEAEAVVRQIEARQKILGNRMYRGLLKSAARAWSPRDIRDVKVLREVLAQMESAELALGRLQDALETLGEEELWAALRPRNLQTLKRMDSLEMLQEIVAAVENYARSSGRSA